MVSQDLVAPGIVLEDGLANVHETGGWTDDNEPPMCFEFEQSVAFLLLFVVTVLAAVAFFVVLALKGGSRRHSGMDILSAILLVSGLLRHSPKVWDALHLHGLDDFSQTGCKLAMYTTVGMPHVVSVVVLLMTLYAMRSLRKGSADAADEFVRSKLAWLVLLLFALEGATGMVPAMFTDLGRDGKSCGRVEGMSIDPVGNAIGHIILISVLPRLIPFALMVYPIIQLRAMTRDVKTEIVNEGEGGEEQRQLERVRTRAQNAMAVAATYVATHAPLAIAALVFYPMMAAGGAQPNWSLLCQFEAAFHFLEDAWYLMVPILLLVRNEEVERTGNGRRIVTSCCNRLGALYRLGGRTEDRIRLS